jgi:putative SOS response-associated peptidase YedK
MCYWVGTKKVREAMKKQFQENPEDEIAQLYYETFIAQGNNLQITLQEHWVAIGKSEPKITCAVKENGKLQFKNLKWTLDWAYRDSKTGETKRGRPLLNSTCEKVFWQHKDLIYSKRCIIPVDGYFEFYHFKGKTYPHFIYPADKSLFYLGGIWNSMVNTRTGEITDSFSIITTPPNSITQKLHNNPDAPNGSRMLLIVDKLDAKKFLNPTLSVQEIKTFFNPYDAKKILYHPTIPFLRKDFAELANSEKVREPFYYPEFDAA